MKEKMLKEFYKELYEKLDDVNGSPDLKYLCRIYRPIIEEFNRRASLAFNPLNKIAIPALIIVLRNYLRAIEIDKDAVEVADIMESFIETTVIELHKQASTETDK